MGKASRAKRERRTSRLLYHFTSTHHLPLIEAAGVIRTAESNLSFLRAHAGPDVVWLMDTPDVENAPHGLTGSVVDKKAVRITVRVPAERWAEWAVRQPAFSGRDAQTLVRTGGGLDAAQHWYVTERPIERKDWVKIEVLRG